MDNEINDLIEDIEEEFMDVMDEDELQGIVGKEIPTSWNTLSLFAS